MTDLNRNNPTMDTPAHAPETRVVIIVGGLESLSPVVSLLAAAGARRVGRYSRKFAVDGPVITALQDGALAQLASEDGVSVSPASVPEEWTITGEYQEIPELSEQEADQWWVARYKDPLR